MSKIVIIGGGPAGVSAGIYSVRAGVDTTILSMGVGALSKAHSIENYYGVSSPITGEALHQVGLSQAKSLGVSIIKEEAFGISFEDTLSVITKKETFFADAIIIATGISRKAPNIPGIKDFETKGVSYCAVCDGFFHKNKDVAVLGSGEYAIHEAEELVPIAKEVTILTNGESSPASIPKNIKVDTRKIKNLEGDNTLSSVVFEDNNQMSLSGLFIAQGSAGSTELAQKIGALTNGNRITVNEKMETNIPGLYAAGDCTEGMLQIAKAVYQGAEAATNAIKFIREK